MTQKEAEDRIGDFLRAEPTLTDVPVDTPAESLRVRHGGYDVRAAAVDHNVVLPLDAMQRAVTEGLIGELHPTAYTFVGATSQLRLRDHAAPAWSERFRGEGIDAFVMVPA